MTLGRRRCFICDQHQQEQPVQLRLIINTPSGTPLSISYRMKTSSLRSGNICRRLLDAHVDTSISSQTPCESSVRWTSNLGLENPVTSFLWAIVAWSFVPFSVLSFCVRLDRPWNSSYYVYAAGGNFSRTRKKRHDVGLPCWSVCRYSNASMH